MKTQILFTIMALSLAATSAAENPRLGHVIHISVDGLRGDSIQSRIERFPQLYPNFKRFVDEGATTFNARTDFTHTNTLPNHTTMLTARPVLRPRGRVNTTHHGYTDNGDPSPRTTLHNGGNQNISYVRSVFDVVHDHGLSTALYASKTKFVLFEQSYNAANGAQDTTGLDNGVDKIDRYLYKGDTVVLNDRLITDMGTNRYNYVFVHYLDLDNAGHGDGWGTKSWDKAAQHVDVLLGQLFDLVESTRGLSGDTAIILTADHGGINDDHGRSRKEENYTIPLLVWGPGVPSGSDLYELNPGTHRNPGRKRPNYNKPLQPLRNGNTGNLALSLLGLPSVEGTITWFKPIAVTD